MESIIVLLDFVLVLLLLVAPIVALLRSAQARRLAKENEERWRQVAERREQGSAGLWPALFLRRLTPGQE